MKQTYFTFCFVLLACAVNVVLSAESLDEWARTYDYKKDINTHIRNLRNARVPVSPNTVPFQMYDIIAKINQRTTGPISVDKVWSTQNDIMAAIKKQDCTVTYNSTYLSIEGDVRYTLYMGFSCTSPDRYLSLCNDINFYSNVIFSRLSTHVSPTFGRIKKTKFMEAIDAPSFDPIPIATPCSNYSNTPLRNWWADAMGGNAEGSMDCNMVVDSCEYNKGYGATLFLIDSGVTSAHNEFTNMEGTKLTYRNHLSPFELGASSWKYDDHGHGTALASLTIGKTLGSVKDAKLVSIKALFKNTTTGFDEVSTTAIISAVNKIIGDITTLGYNRTSPMLIYSGLNIIYELKHKCHVLFSTNPSDSIAVRNTNRDVDNTINKRTTVLTPGAPTPDPPTSSGYFKYDCAFQVVQAIKRVIAYGVPYLITSGNGFAFGDYAGYGVDICFYAQWAATVNGCVPYLYMPLFMVNPVMSGTSLWNTGNRHRPIVIGGYQEDFDNAKWNNFLNIDPTNGTANFGDAGGAHYGSQWMGSNRCVDYAAPATRFDTLPVLPGIKYGQWNDDYNGTFIYDDYGNYTPSHLGLSGTSYAVPLAAGSIISTMVRFWPTIKPLALPDYTFGNRLINTIDANNVIGSGFHMSNDTDIQYVYNYYSWYLTESDVMAGGSCANLTDTYYTSDNYPAPVSLINTPYNRNLKMPKFPSGKPSCQVSNPTPVPPSYN